MITFYKDRNLKSLKIILDIRRTSSTSLLRSNINSKDNYIEKDNKR